MPGIFEIAARGPGSWAEFLDAVFDVRAKLLEGAQEENSDMAESAAQAMRERVPQDSGRLHDSIRTRVSKNKRNVDVVVGNREMYYLGFVEFGTQNMEPQPFIRPVASEWGGKLQTRQIARARKQVGTVRVRGG